MGCHRYHFLRVPPHLHLHRSKSKLLPWEYLMFQVKFFLCDARENSSLIFTTNYSYLVLLGGFYFSPNTSESGDYEPAPTTLLLQFAEPVLSSFGHVQALFLSLFTR